MGTITKAAALAAAMALTAGAASAHTTYYGNGYTYPVPANYTTTYPTFNSAWTGSYQYIGDITNSLQQTYPTYNYPSYTYPTYTYPTNVVPATVRTPGYTWPTYRTYNCDGYTCYY